MVTRASHWGREASLWFVCRFLVNRLIWEEFHHCSSWSALGEYSGPLDEITIAKMELHCSEGWQMKTPVDLVQVWLSGSLGGGKVSAKGKLAWKVLKGISMSENLLI